MRAISSAIPVVVTGASSGLGAQFARQFARRGHDVTLVARRIDRLEALAKSLEREFSITATPMQSDLETVQGRDAVAETVRHSGPWILVNNAGFGTRGRFVELDGRRESAEVALNVLAVTELTAAALPGCVDVGEGGVINVASIAAFQPLPYMANYAATKAFVLHFTEALGVELHGTGVRVQALCPGPTRTEFGDVAGNARELNAARPMTAERVVSASLKAFDRNRTICLPGAVNTALSLGSRFAPRAAVRRTAAMMFAPRD
ncbi:MAG: SDR family oxidoreductase [Cyanobacteria bacterium REEB65]|nr:SDR family oxidoreductase [Cyanobacteria bacterium REEB65]